VPTAGDTVILNSITPNQTVVAGAAVGDILAVGQTATGEHAEEEMAHELLRPRAEDRPENALRIML
jgi:hypothetical protein